MVAIDLGAWPPDFGDWQPETWTAAAAWATVVVYVVIALYARYQLREARELREQQARPFVVAEFDPGFLIKFRVRNYGNTLARNVRITWDNFPTVTAKMNDPVWQGPENSVLFSTGIPQLAPGQLVETLFDHFPDRVEQRLPMRYTVTVDYDRFDEKRHFSESHSLDLDLYRGLRSVDRKDVHDVAQEMKKVRDVIEKWTDGNRGLKVLSVNRQRSQRNENRPYRLTQARRTLRRTGWRGLLRTEWREFLRRRGFYTLD